MGLRIQLPAVASPPLPSIDVTPTLEGVTYTLHMQWDETSALWLLRVLDNLGQTVLMGDQAMVAEWPLYASRVLDLRQPPGLFFVRDTANQGENPTLDGLGARWQLWYFSAAEVAALGIT